MSREAQATVLIVDDDADVADSYAAFLPDRFAVETAYSGQAALDGLGPAVDVVLLDRRMPGISGDDVLTEIRDRDLDARVAMVTAVEPDFDIIEMPFDDYVVKPVAREELVETVDRLRRCTAYQESIRVFYALSAKYAALEASKSPTELEANSEFEALAADVSPVRDRIDELIAEFDDGGFRTLFKDIGDPADFESVE